MEISRFEKVRVSGFRDEQNMETHFEAGAEEVKTTEGDRKFFEVRMEGDVIVDDGEMTYGVFSIEMTTEEVVQLHSEIDDWFRDQGIFVSPFKLWDLGKDKFDLVDMAKNFQKIDEHDGTPGRGVNRQDDSSSS